MSFRTAFKIVKTSISCSAFLYWIVLEWRVINMCLVIILNLKPIICLIFFNVYFWEREKVGKRTWACTVGEGHRERGRHRIWNSLQAPSPCGAWTQEPWGHDLSWSWMLTDPGSSHCVWMFTSPEARAAWVSCAQSCSCRVCFSIRAALFSVPVGTVRGVFGALWAPFETLLLA